MFGSASTGGAGSFCPEAKMEPLKGLSCEGLSLSAQPSLLAAAPQVGQEPDPRPGPQGAPRAHSAFILGERSWGLGLGCLLVSNLEREDPRDSPLFPSAGSLRNSLDLLWGSPTGCIREAGSQLAARIDSWAAAGVWRVCVASRGRAPAPTTSQHLEGVGGRSVTQAWILF